MYEIIKPCGLKANKKPHYKIRLNNQVIQIIFRQGA